MMDGITEGFVTEMCAIGVDSTGISTTTFALPMAVLTVVGWPGVSAMPDVAVAVVEDVALGMAEAVAVGDGVVEGVTVAVNDTVIVGVLVDVVAPVLVGLEVVTV